MLTIKKCAVYLVGILYYGCYNNTSNVITDDKNETFEISIENRELNVDDLFYMDSLTLQMPKGKYLGNITDLCTNDGVLFVLDDNKQITSFDLESGIMQKQIHKVGKERSEYLSPKALHANKDGVYILDDYSFIRYTKTLEFMEKIPLKFIALDFINENDQFLFYNLFASPETRRIIQTDKKGNITGSYGDSEVLNESVNTTYFLRKTKGDKVYLSEPTSGKIFVFRNGTYENTINILLKDEEERADVDFTDYAEAFLLGDYIIQSYFRDDKRNYCFYNLSDRSYISGHSTISGHPFFPRWQMDDTLIGFEARQTNDDEIYVVTFYTLR